MRDIAAIRTAATGADIELSLKEMFSIALNVDYAGSQEPFASRKTGE